MPLSKYINGSDSYSFSCIFKLYTVSIPISLNFLSNFTTLKFKPNSIEHFNNISLTSDENILSYALAVIFKRDSGYNADNQSQKNCNINSFEFHNMYLQCFLINRVLSV